MYAAADQYGVAGLTENDCAGEETASPPSGASPPPPPEWPPSLATRLSLVLRSLILYSRWFDLDPAVLPPAFHEALDRA
eukprot:CAMPEP_0172632064 /NCGR_PEP_ID=MMETSP1068-20121228/182548_1 /TAXON_ID=35684 /ORGANISM="Pseudopedinella elastica, Strain CCMP716" /LENGTH=78 /DNA_ID=CAMNT_0013443365 /DNA_START=26 /DNA_END=260 /DNA_ORIENTATION=+